jgi:hypothetical protein
MLSFQSVKKFVLKYKLIILAVLISIAIAIYLKQEVLKRFFKNIIEMFEDDQEDDQEQGEEWDGKVTSCKLISDEKVKNWCYDGCTNSAPFKKANDECLQAKCKDQTGYKKVECLKNNDIVETCVAEVAAAFC